MWYAVLFIVISGQPRLILEDTPYRQLSDCNTATNELVELYSSHVDFMAVKCVNIDGENI